MEGRGCPGEVRGEELDRRGSKTTKTKAKGERARVKQHTNKRNIKDKFNIDTNYKENGNTNHREK